MVISWKASGNINESLPLVKDAVTPLSKSLHIPLGLTAAASPADAENH